MHDNRDRSAVSVRTAELAVAGFFFLLGALVMYDSARIGARWGDDGPQAGYFPFYVGALICLSTGVIFVRALVSRTLAAKSFVARGQIGLVLQVLVPSIVYVVVIRFLGIYVASPLFIVYFMIRLGHYNWTKAVAVGVGVSVVFFLLFEVWFKVPLPKGPLESMLGLD